MELRQLRYFVAVAEELHFRRAAVRLHITQPPLSQQIAALETELGCRLLERTRRKVELTAAGAAFLDQVRALLSELEVAADTARSIDAGQVGVLRLSFVGSALLSALPALVQRFRAERPRVELQLRERSTVEQLRALRAGTIDVGLVRPPLADAADLEVRRVVREATIAAVPETHPLARLRRIPLQRLAGEPLVLFPREQAPGFHDLLVDRLRTTGVTPRVAQYAPEMLTIIGLVAAGIGVSPVPESMRELAFGGVAYRPLVGAPRSELALVTRAAESSPLVQAFAARALEPA